MKKSTKASEVKERIIEVTIALIQNNLGLLGVISLLSYTAAVVFSPLAYPDYNWMAQTASDLSVSNAPSKMLCHVSQTAPLFPLKAAGI